MPTLKTIGSAPVTSPLTGVDLEDVGMFLVQLTNRDFLQSKPENIDELGSDFVFQIFFLNSLRFSFMREADKKKWPVPKNKLLVKL